tara:strand:+ start:9705 stop:11885 length:2181 start_codon:yes stop_codon:yes gene_type:complete
MNQPSQEQQQIIDYVKDDFNIRVEAVAGSGKSTTVLSLANQCPSKEILQLTYNSSLRLEIKEKVETLNINNIKIHTFHSLAVKYYSRQAHTDTGIRHILLYKLTLLQPIPKIDILVIDENQDFTELYFQFVLKFLLDYAKPIQIICLGDPRQCIYEFKGADPRFLTMADEIWSPFFYLKTNKFIKCNLRTSYRITNQMGFFVNKALIGDNLMLTCRDGDPVTYIRNNRKNVENILIFNIKNLITNGIKPDDIFILAASIKGINSYIRKLENRLVEHNIPCHVPIFETEKLDERVIDGKIVFSTFHSVKGRQRPFVFILGFDNNYFIQYARTLPKNECPNTLYVGCTRAIKHLFLIEYDERPTDRPLEFLKMGHRDLVNCSFVDFKGFPRKIFHNSDSSQDNIKSLIEKRFETPTKMVQFIPDFVLNEISPIIDKIFDFSQVYTTNIEIPSVIQTNYGFEDVSDLNGIAIPSFFYEKISKNNILKSLIDQSILEMRPNEHFFLKNTIKNIPETFNSINDYLYLSNIYISIQERLYFKLKQINSNEYNWINNELLNQCIERLEKMIVENNQYIPSFEKTLIHNSNESLHENIDHILKPHFTENILFRFSAIIDVFSENSIWELKFTNQISIEHKIQLVIYAWIYQSMNLPSRDFKLFNIKTGELYVLNSNFDDLSTIVISILKGKYEKPLIKTDIEFRDSVKKHMNSITIQHLIDESLNTLDLIDSIF